MAARPTFFITVDKERGVDWRVLILTPYKLPTDWNGFLNSALGAIEQVEHGLEDQVHKILIFTMDPNAKHLTILHSKYDIQAYPPDHPVYQDFVESVPQFKVYSQLMYGAMLIMAYGVGLDDIDTLMKTAMPKTYHIWTYIMGKERAEQVFLRDCSAIISDKEYLRLFKEHFDTHGKLE